MSDLAKDVTSSSVLCLRIALTDIPILVDCKATTTKCPSMLSQTIQYINNTCFFFRLFFYFRFKNFNYLHSGESTHWTHQCFITEINNLVLCYQGQWSTEMKSVSQGELRVRCRIYVDRHLHKLFYRDTSEHCLQLIAKLSKQNYHLEIKRNLYFLILCKQHIIWY